MARLGPLLAALMLGPGVAQAATVTIDFDDLDDPGSEALGFGQVGNVNYFDQNWGLYGISNPFLYLSSGDLFNRTEITADPGTYFTPLAFDLSASRNVQRVPCPDCTPEEVEALIAAANEGRDVGFAPHAVDFVRIAGYRDGDLVAEDVFGAESAVFPGPYEFSAAFAGISRLLVELAGDLYEFPALREDGFVYGCPPYQSQDFNYCVTGAVDNFTVVTDVAPVPLPSGLPLYLGALGMGAAVLRRQSR